DAQTPDTVGYVPFAVLVPGTTTDMRQTFHFVKLALNYKFGEDPWSDWGGGLLGDDGMHGVAAGWSLETGTRYWASSGKFQWDVGIPPPPDVLISRLSYRGLTGHSAEL